MLTEGLLPADVTATPRAQPHRSVLRWILLLLMHVFRILTYWLLPFPWSFIGINLVWGVPCGFSKSDDNQPDADLRGSCDWAETPREREGSCDWVESSPEMEKAGRPSVPHLGSVPHVAGKVVHALGYCINAALMVYCCSSFGTAVLEEWQVALACYMIALGSKSLQTNNG